MAEDKKDAAEAAEEQPKKSKMKLLLIIAAAVLAGGGAGAFFMLKGGDTPADGAQGSATEQVESKPAAGLVAMDTFLVNLNDPGGDRYMKLTLRLTISPESVAEEVSADSLMQARLRDRVLTVLTTKTLAELINPLGKEALRREIQDQLGPMIASGEVQDVLFSEFVVQ